MQLRGQHGYAMAALLVGMSVAAVLMTAAMPAWKQMARREREAELIFRGQQYARAIGLFQKRAGPGVLPPNVDVLVTQRFLRKKFKDPITGDDFDLLMPTTQAANTPGAPANQGRGGLPTTSGAQPPARGNAATTQGGLITAQSSTGRGGAGGVIGVASKSKEESLRIYNGRTRYNEWQFVYVQQTQAPGAGNPGRGGTQQPVNPQTGRGGMPGAPQGGFGRGGAIGGRGSPPVPPR